jgi:hypothetical protein
MLKTAARWILVGGWALAPASAAWASPGAPARPLDSSASATPACIHARAEARYANYGYDHWVIIHDGCDADAACAVTTNVNPNPTSVSVPKGKAREVLTFRGSPAREFSAKVACTLQE